MTQEWHRNTEYWNGALTVEKFGPPRQVKLHINRQHPAILDFGPFGQKLCDIMEWAASLAIGLSECPDPKLRKFIRTSSWRGISSINTLQFRYDKSGCVSSYFDNEKNCFVDDEVTALLLIMAYWSNQIYVYDNPPPNLKLSNERYHKAFIDRFPMPAEIIADTGWNSVRYGRCIYSYNRTITFGRKLNPMEISLIKEKFRLSDNYRKSVVEVINGTTFSMREDYDSSD